MNVDLLLLSNRSLPMSFCLLTTPPPTDPREEGKIQQTAESDHPSDPPPPSRAQAGLLAPETDVM